MAGSLTNHGEKLALNLIFRKGMAVPGGTPNVAPDGTTGLYIGLAKGVINETSTIGAPNAITEVTDTHYNRQHFTFNEPITDGSGYAVVKNVEDIQFGPWDVTEVGAITYCFITDAQNGVGNIIAYMSLDASKTPAMGDMLVFYADGLAFSID
jgi:hypothetical protein